jgi:hypothetical protein
VLLDIRYLEGETKGVLIVAPHGPYQTKDEKIKHRNDLRTGIIAEEIHKILGCSTIINDAYIKPDEDKNETASLKDKRLDLFKVEQAKEVPDYLKAIQDAVDKHDGKTLVIWLHGILDANADSEKIKHIKARLMKKGDGDLHALIGYGQGKPTRYTAEQKTVDTIRDELTKQGLRTLIIRKDAENYRGWDEERLNQWFLIIKYPLEKVQSFQIEIRQKGFREDAEQCRNTARIIANAISATLEMKPVVKGEAVSETQPVKPTAPDKDATEDTVPPDVSVPVQDNVAEIVLDDEDPLVKPTAPDKDATEDTVPPDVSVPVQVIEPEIIQDDEDPVVEQTTSNKTDTENTLSIEVPVLLQKKEAEKDPIDDQLVENAFEYLKNIFSTHFHEAMLAAGRYLIEEFYGGYEQAIKKKPTKAGSLRQLIDRLQKSDGNTPSKTWIYDAVKLASDEHRLSGFPTYGHIGHSHKVLLTHVKNIKRKKNW